MSNGISNFLKGVGTGMVAGIAVAAAATAMVKDNKKLKKKACRAMNTVSNIMENITTILQ
jgi:hypothetical protein